MGATCILCNSEQDFVSQMKKENETNQQFMLYVSDYLVRKNIIVSPKTEEQFVHDLKRYKLLEVLLPN